MDSTKTHLDTGKITGSETHTLAVIYVEQTTGTGQTLEGAGQAAGVL